MDKINRYLYQVKRYLNGRNEDDIIKELRSLILDELEASSESSKEEKEAHLDEILKSFGHPRNVAAEYSKQGSLILEPLTPIFWMVLKIIVIVVPAALILGTAIDFFMQSGANDFMKLLLHMLQVLPGILSSVFASIGILFLIFYVISRNISEQELDKLNEFDPSRLPKVPESQYRLKMVDAFFEIIGSALFIYILNYKQGVFGIYQNGESIPFLNESFNTFLIFINIALGLRIFLTLFHIYMNRKTFETKTMEFILTLYSVTIVTVLAFSDVLNQNLIGTYNIDFLPTLFRASLLFAAIISLVVGMVDYGKALINKPKDSQVT